MAVARAPPADEVAELAPAPAPEAADPAADEPAALAALAEAEP